MSNTEEALREALNSLIGVSVTCTDHRANQQVHAWFRVTPEQVPVILPFLTRFVATNYDGLPFVIMLDDTGDGDAIGRFGSLLLHLESRHTGHKAVALTQTLIARIYEYAGKEKLLKEQHIKVLPKQTKEKE
jgi:hypothetical protein